MINEIYFLPLFSNIFNMGSNIEFTKHFSRKIYSSGVKKITEAIFEGYIERQLFSANFLALNYYSNIRIKNTQCHLYLII